MNKQELSEALVNFGLIIDEKTSDQLEQYLIYILAENMRTNLTAIKDPEEIRSKHFLDSLSLYKYAKESPDLIDVGSGAGFPGIPLAIVLPRLKVTLVEATRKKCDFLEMAVKELKLTNVTVLNTRAEELPGSYRAELVTARAVAELGILAELCLPLVKRKGLFIAMKGPKYQEEIEKAKYALAFLGGKEKEIHEYQLPGNEQRFNLVYEKVKATPAGYPRRYALIKSKPLGAEE